jgi:ribosomal protein S14
MSDPCPHCGRPMPKAPKQYTKPRGVCQICGREVALVNDGRLQHHKSGSEYGRFGCEGSYTHPSGVVIT